MKEKKIDGEKSFEFGQMMYYLGQIYLLQGKYEEAEKYYNQSLSIYEAAPEKPYADIAKVLDRFGDINLDGYGEASLAENYYTQALDLRKKEFTAINIHWYWKATVSLEIYTMRAGTLKKGKRLLVVKW